MDQLATVILWFVNLLRISSSVLHSPSIYLHLCIEREKERERDRGERERKKERKTDREREKERKKERKREIASERERGWRRRGAKKEGPGTKQRVIHLQPLTGASWRLCPGRSSSNLLAALCLTRTCLQFTIWSSGSKPPQSWVKTVGQNHGSPVNCPIHLLRLDDLHW